MRGNTQLRVWEMQEMDEEAKAFVDRILRPRKVPIGGDPPATDSNKKQGSSPAPAHYSSHDIAAIAPFAMEPLPVGVTNEHPSRSSDTVPTYGFATHHFHRPPVFGPEVIVLDPHIKAVHRQLMIDVVRFGFWFMLVRFEFIKFMSYFCVTFSLSFSGFLCHHFHCTWSSTLLTTGAMYMSNLPTDADA